MAKINIINAKRKYEGAIHAAIYCRVSTAQAFQIHDNSPLVLELLQSQLQNHFKRTSIYYELPTLSQKTGIIVTLLINPMRFC